MNDERGVEENWWDACEPDVIVGVAVKSWWGVGMSDGRVGVAVSNQWGGVECGGGESGAECDGVDQCIAELEEKLSVVAEDM